MIKNLSEQELAQVNGGKKKAACTWSDAGRDAFSSASLGASGGLAGMVGGAIVGATQCWSKNFPSY